MSVQLENPLCFYEASKQESTLRPSDEVAAFVGVLCALLDDPQRGRCSTRAAVIDVDLPLVDGRVTRSVSEDEGSPAVDPILGLLSHFVARLHSSK